MDIRGPLAEDAENTGPEVLPVDMHPIITCVGGTENVLLASEGGATPDNLPTACVCGTQKDVSFTSIREGVWISW